MKRNTDTLPKFKGLAKELGTARYATIGVLEAIWDLTGKHAPRGNVGKFSNQEIADDIGWDGDADALIAALIKHRWIDTSDKYRLLIHDWKDHAPDWLKKAVHRAGFGWACDDDNGGHRQPVADSGSQWQPPAASGGLPTHTFPTQTYSDQTKPTPESACGGETFEAVVTVGSIVEKASRKVKSKPAPVEFPSELDTPEFREVWAAYVQFRSEQKFKPLGATAVGQKFRQFAGWGSDRAVAAIRYSMANGWQGIFEENRNGSGVNGKHHGQARLSGWERREQNAAREFPEDIKLPIA